MTLGASEAAERIAFTPYARKVVAFAQEIAASHGTSTITPTFSAGWCIWVAGSRPSTYAAPESPKRGSTTLTPRPRKVERSRWRFVTRPALSDARDDLRRLG
jgi:hypothetical protein